MTAGPAVGWVGETDARTQTTSPTLDELSFPAMELYAMPAATATLLEDSAVNIDQWLAAEVEQAFAEQEGTAFVTGDGSNKPKGFLSYTTVANSSWAWGNIGYIATGAAGAFPSTAPSDVLVDLIYALKAGYRQNAVFVMNRKTQARSASSRTRRRLLWQPPARRAGRASLMTFPVMRPRTCRTSRRIRSRSRSAISGAAIWSSTARASRAARSVHRQALRAVLHDQARRRRRAGLRRDQAAEVRGELIVPPHKHNKKPGTRRAFCLKEV